MSEAVIEPVEAGGELYIKGDDGLIHRLVDGPSLRNPDVTVKYSVVLEPMISRGQKSRIAQYDKIVLPGTILARNCFMGLSRNLYNDDDKNGDKCKYALSWKPKLNWEWQGTGYQGGPKKLDPPKDQVFVIFVSENKNHKDKFPQIEGWIDRWAWIEQDMGGAEEAPVGWVDRFDDRIWHKGN